MSLNFKTDKTELDFYIEESLPKIIAEETKKSLGDRTKYIGASDIGSCLRKAYLSKKHVVEHDIAQYIVFQRGHLSEGIVEKMLQGTNYSTQVEAKGKAVNGFDIKAHIDFTINSKKEIVVIEAKSTSMPVNEPYESWILQIQLQMGLLQKKHPNKLIRGYVIAIDVNTGWKKTFKVSQNQTLYDIAYNKANILATALYKNEEPLAEQQLFCSKCPFKKDCPALISKSTTLLPLEVSKYIKKLGLLKQYEKEAWSIKKLLKDFMQVTNKNVAKVNNTTIQLVSKENNYDMDVARFKIEEPELYSKYRKKKDAPYSYVKVI